MTTLAMIVKVILMCTADLNTTATCMYVRSLKALVQSWFTVQLAIVMQDNHVC